MGQACLHDSLPTPLVLRVEDVTTQQVKAGLLCALSSRKRATRTYGVEEGILPGPAPAL